MESTQVDGKGSRDAAGLTMDEPIGARPLRAHRALAASLSAHVAARRRDRRAHAVGARGARGHGLCGHRRPAAASGPLHAGRVAARLRAAGDRAPPLGPGHVGDGGAPRHLRRRRGRRRGGLLRSQDLRGLRGRLRARHRRGVPRGRPRQAGLHHAVPLQAGHGRLRGRPRHLRDGGAALQALRRGEARGQHDREARGDDQGAAPGRLDHLRGGSRGAGAALPAAAPEPEDPGRPGRAVRGDRAERGARSGGRPRRGGRRALCRKGCRRPPCRTCRSPHWPGWW